MSENTLGRDFVIGDLHGQLNQLLDVLDQAAFNPATDRVFSVGDLIDRGPDSLACLRLIERPWFHAVWGNHEAIALQALEKSNPAYRDYWDNVGGRWGRVLSPLEIQEVKRLLLSLPVAIVVGAGRNRFNVLHAEWLSNDEGLSTDSAAVKAGLYSMVWGRDLIRGCVEVPEGDEFAHQGLSATFVGHCVLPRVGCIGSMIYIDTGAGGTGHLTMLEPKTGHQYHAKRKELELEW